MKVSRVSIYLTALFFSACSPVSKISLIQRANLPQTLPAEVVVFVPGFEGSELHSAKGGETVWITFSDALINGGTLAIPHPELSLERPGKNLKSGNVILGVYAPFNLYNYDIYGDALKNLRAELPAGISIVCFGYDWRNSIDGSAKELAEFITQLKSRGVKRVDLVSHSMGGLVAWYYLRYGSATIDKAVENWQGAKEVHSVVFSGTPFRGALKMFHDLQTGIEAGFNSSLLSAEALGTFDSAYEMMPGPDQESLLSSDLSSQDGEMHDVRNWEDQEWGLLQRKSDLPEDILYKRYAFTEQELSHAAEFANLVTAPRAIPMPPLPVFVLAGTGKPTMARSVWLADKKRIIFSADDLAEYNSKLSADVLTRDGDLVVTADSASAPAAISKEENVIHRKLEADHLGIINSPVAVHAIVEFITGGSLKN